MGTKVEVKVQYRMTCDRINHRTKKGFGVPCSYCEYAGYNATTGYYWNNDSYVHNVADVYELTAIMESYNFVDGSEAVITTANYKIEDTTLALRHYKDREPQIKKENQKMHKEDKR